MTYIKTQSPASSCTDPLNSPWAFHTLRALQTTLFYHIWIPSPTQYTHSKSHTAPNLLTVDSRWVIMRPHLLFHQMFSPPPSPLPPELYPVFLLRSPSSLHSVKATVDASLAQAISIHRSEFILATASMNLPASGLESFSQARELWAISQQMLYPDDPSPRQSIWQACHCGSHFVLQPLLHAPQHTAYSSPHCGLHPTSLYFQHRHHEPSVPVSWLQSLCTASTLHVYLPWPHVHFLYLA